MMVACLRYSVLRVCPTTRFFPAIRAFGTPQQVMWYRVVHGLQCKFIFFLGLSRNVRFYLLIFLFNVFLPTV